MQPQDPAAPSNPPSQPGFARRAAEALKKAVWRSEPAEPGAATGVATVATLSERVKKYLPSSDVQKIKDAFRFSDEAHLGQFRRSGAPYITHPLAVAEILTDWRLDGAAIQAALLHDVLEDSGTTEAAARRAIRQRSSLNWSTASPSSTSCSSPPRSRRRPKTSARCCWRWRATCASC